MSNVPRSIQVDEIECVYTDDQLGSDRAKKDVVAERFPGFPDLPSKSAEAEFN